MNEIVTILLGAVLPLITILWQLTRCAKMIRRMRENRNQDTRPSGRLLHATLCS